MFLVLVPVFCSRLLFPSFRCSPFSFFHSFFPFVCPIIQLKCPNFLKELENGLKHLAYHPTCVSFYFIKPEQQCTAQHVMHLHTLWLLNRIVAFHTFWLAGWVVDMPHSIKGLVRQAVCKIEYSMLGTVPNTTVSFLSHASYIHILVIQIDNILHMDFQLEIHTSSSLPALLPLRIRNINEYSINGYLSIIV